MIKREILWRGPAVVGLMATNNFLNFKGTGISMASEPFDPNSNQGHAVTIIGWGRSGSTDYWIVQNPWGVYWGDNGFGKMEFGALGMLKGFPWSTPFAPFLHSNANITYNSTLGV